MLSSKPQSLFGHLAVRFSAHPENLATEALNYILNRSATSRCAFVRYLTQSGASLSEAFTFRTQLSGDDQTVPDLVGIDMIGKQEVLVEAKFWAGLTDAQPVGYLHRLREQGGSLLLFLAPAMRFATLWPELLRRCGANGLILKEKIHVSGELLSATTDDNQVLALASWRSLLQHLRGAAETAREMDSLSDISQLTGLCERMDDKAFWPLRSEELASVVGLRIAQFCGVVDEVIDRAVAQGLVSVKGFRPSAAFGWYGRYFAIDEYGCRLAVDANHWSQLRETPIWLSIYAQSEGHFVCSPMAKKKLTPLELEDPPRLLSEGEDLLVPIYMPTGAERGLVLQTVLGQLEEVAALLRK